ncbi:MAG: hypothetical protein WCE44_15800, partial [Candidatus Velthaea sp.]
MRVVLRVVVFLADVVPAVDDDFFARDDALTAVAFTAVAFTAGAFAAGAFFTVVRVFAATVFFVAGAAAVFLAPAAARLGFGVATGSLATATAGEAAPADLVRLGLTSAAGAALVWAVGAGSARSAVASS